MLQAREYLSSCLLGDEKLDNNNKHLTWMQISEKSTQASSRATAKQEKTSTIRKERCTNDFNHTTRASSRG